jgi:L,D-peptidoglycan transpeptidase YkuD (ErfK/YbiS/YcfS/YnhG family)
MGRTLVDAGLPALLGERPMTEVRSGTAALVVTAAVLGLLLRPVVAAAGPPPTLQRVPAGHDQAITVTASSARSTTASYEVWQRSASGWTRVMGPWTAHVGYNGVAAAGAKREGDGRTPSGVYGFAFAFGVDTNPGTRLAWRPVSSRTLVWDDDSASHRYNLWTDTRYADAGRSPEPLQVTPAYDEAVVIAYNTARKPGLGSAIFLHVSTGRSTAGCVSLPAAALTKVLRWLAPAAHPVISIGTA